MGKYLPEHNFESLPSWAKGIPPSWRSLKLYCPPKGGKNTVNKRLDFKEIYQEHRTQEGE